MSSKDVFASVKESFKFKKFASINGTKYGLAVLSMGQEKKVNAYLETLNNNESMEYLNELKRAIVSEAMISINDEVLGKTIKVPGDDGKEVEKDKAIAVKEFLIDLPAQVTTDLFDVYVDVREQSEDALKKEMKYDWFKTPEQRDKDLEEKNKKEAELEKNLGATPEKTKEEEIQDIKLTRVVEASADEVPK
jgi:hypothetical protein